MKQHVFEVVELPHSGTDAAAAFYTEHLDQVRALCEGAKAVAIILPTAAPDHTDWRRGVARDLAREHAPVRVNLIAPSSAKSREALLKYIGDAKGVTGHYLETE